MKTGTPTERCSGISTRSRWKMYLQPSLLTGNTPTSDCPALVINDYSRKPFRMTPGNGGTAPERFSSSPATEKVNALQQAVMNKAPQASMQIEKEELRAVLRQRFEACGIDARLPEGTDSSYISGSVQFALEVDMPLPDSPDTIAERRSSAKTESMSSSMEVIVSYTCSLPDVPYLSAQPLNLPKSPMLNLKMKLKTQNDPAGIK